MSSRVLIIDDDPELCRLLSAKLDLLGHRSATAMTLGDGLREAAQAPYDVVYLDIGMPDGNGLSSIPAIRAAQSSPEVIIITGDPTMSGARRAIESGAWDYVEKGSSLDELILPLMRALQYRRETDRARAPLSLKREKIIGHSSGLVNCLDQVAQAAGSTAPVLISGETGTGKEIFATTVHENSDRQNGNFVVIDCAAIPETLVESHLFGHRAGSFTGATQHHTGLIKEADGGTLFLDEVGELSLDVQKSFLRVLQEQRFRRVGGKRMIHSDFRLIAATNRDLEEMVNQGGFRADLLFRLQSITINLPPLRERGKDITELAMWRSGRYSLDHDQESKGLSPELLAALHAYQWPGNIRELFNAIDQAHVAAGQGPTLFAFHLPPKIRLKTLESNLRQPAGGSPVSDPGFGPDPALPLPSLKDGREAAIARYEAEYLRRLMTQVRWNVKEACGLAKVSRPRLYELLKKHAISRPG